MKKDKQKGKDGRGGARLGAGGGGRWKHGRTKLVRLPVVLLDEILEVARYMDLNHGQLPPSVFSLITYEYPLNSLSDEKKSGKFFKKVMSGLESFLISDTIF